MSKRRPTPAADRGPWTFTAGDAPPALALPHLPTLAALAAALGLDPVVLGILCDGRHYETVQQRKRHGWRTISRPVAGLATAQRWILEHILSALPVHPAAHGYVPGRSVKTAVAPHCGRAVLVTLDLAGWFPSITLLRVARVFACSAHRPCCRYPDDVALALAQLCCWRNPQGEYVLPQGACTSPALANLVVAPMDERISGLAAIDGCRYTRYADDLILSYGTSPSPVSSMILAVERAVEASGFHVNLSKTRVMYAGINRQEALGLLLNDPTGPRLPREERRRLRAVSHQAEATGEPPTPRDAGRLAHGIDVERR